MFANMKLGVRLAMAFAVTLALLVAIAVIGVTRISTLNSEIHDVVKQEYPKVIAAGNIAESVAVIGRHLRNGYLYTGAERQTSIDNISKEGQSITENIATLEKLVKSDKGKELVGKVKSARQSYLASQNKAIELIKADAKREEFNALMQGDLRKSQTEYNNAIAELNKHQEAGMEKAGERAEEEAASAARLLSILSVVAAVLTAVVGWLITRSILKQLGGEPDYAREMVVRVAEGDLTVKLVTNPKDQSSLLFAMKTMIEKLSQVVSDVNSGAQSLASASEEVSATSQSLSQASSQQAAGVEETSASIEQMTSSIAQNTENAKITDGMASKAAKEA
ncbi:MAG: MCP four helix bundle domain-containing protein, partial [Rhodoferax sp.]